MGERGWGITSQRRRYRRRGSLLTVGALVLFGFGAIASFADDPPTSTDDGRKHCVDFNPSWTEFEVDPAADGQFSDGTLTVTIVFDEETRVFDWSSDIGVDAVFVKGSDTAGNLYRYDPEATSDSGLHAPLKETTPEEGDFYSINHILFCYDTDVPPTASPSPTVSPTDTQTPEPTVSPTETETPGPTVSPTETETPEPTVSPTETETPGPTVSPTETATVAPTGAQTSPAVLGRKVLGRTGSNLLTLAWWALALVAIGVFSYVVAARAYKRQV